MKTPIALLIALSLILGVAVAPVMAVEHPIPIGGCPKSFPHLHKAMDADSPGGVGDHEHVGNDKDLNEDGWICGKHVGKDGTVHVHIDNNVPKG